MGEQPCEICPVSNSGGSVKRGVLSRHLPCLGTDVDSAKGDAFICEELEGGGWSSILSSPSNCIDVIWHAFVKTFLPVGYPHVSAEAPPAVLWRLWLLAQLSLY